MIHEDSFKLDLLFLCTYKKWEIPVTIIRTFPTNFLIYDLTMTTSNHDVTKGQ